MKYKNMNFLKFFLSNMYGIEEIDFHRSPMFTCGRAYPLPPKTICELTYKTIFAILLFPFMLVHFAINVISIMKKNSMKFGLCITGIPVFITTVLSYSFVDISIGHWLYLYFTIHLALAIVILFIIASMPIIDYTLPMAEHFRDFCNEKIDKTMYVIRSFYFSICDRIGTVFNKCSKIDWSN